MKRWVPSPLIAALLFLALVACAPSRLTMTLREVEPPADAQQCALEQPVVTEEEMELIGQSTAKGTSHPAFYELGEDFFGYMLADEIRGCGFTCYYLARPVEVYADPYCATPTGTTVQYEGLPVIEGTSDCFMVATGNAPGSPGVLKVGYVKRPDLWRVALTSEDAAGELYMHVRSRFPTLCPCLTSPGIDDIVRHSGHR